MSNFRQVDRETGFLLPPSVDEWLPERHLARFVVEVIEGLDLRAMSGSYRGSGSASYHPAMLLGVLVYGYATGVFSSRKLERATYDSVAFRFIAANDHPDHDTIATFRRRFLQGDRGAVRQGAVAGPRDGGAQTGHGGAGRDQDPRQCEPPQRAFLSARGQAGGAAEGRGGGAAGQGRGGGQGGYSRRDVDPRGIGAARRTTEEAGRGAHQDRGARQRALGPRAGGV